VRWKWAAAWVIACGSLTIAMLPAGRMAAVAKPAWLGAYLLNFALFGAVLLISGGVSFWLYLRHTQPPAQEAQ
jgi:hypothetical protein